MRAVRHRTPFLDAKKPLFRPSRPSPRSVLTVKRLCAGPAIEAFDEYLAGPFKTFVDKSAALGQEVSEIVSTPLILPRCSDKASDTVFLRGSCVGHSSVPVLAVLS